MIHCPGDIRILPENMDLEGAFQHIFGIDLCFFFAFLFFFCFSVATVIYVTLIKSSSYDCARQVNPSSHLARINMMLELVSGSDDAGQGTDPKTELRQYPKLS